MKKKIIAYTIGILGCIIIDAAFVATAIYHEATVSDYILMGIFFPIVDFLFLVLVGLTFEDSEYVCLVIQLPEAVVDDSLPILKLK